AARAPSRGGRLGVVDGGDEGAGVDWVAFGDRELGDGAGFVGADLVFHFHCFDRCDQLALVDVFAFFDVDLPDVALEWGVQLIGAGGGVRGRGAVAGFGGGTPASGGVGVGGGWWRADHGDVKAPARDLDGVGLLNRLVVLRGLGGRCVVAGGREPGAVFD